MLKLVLIKHAPPLVDPGKPSHEWRLSDSGRAKCEPLARLIAPHAPTIVVASEEPKARETAQIVAQHLKIETTTAPGLHEHDRTNVPHMRSAEFISMVELFFRRPKERVLGRETADEALSRFERAIDEVLNQHAGRNIALVSHGTVIALYLAKLANRSGFELWRELQLPSFGVVSIPEMRLEELTPRVDPV